MVDPGTELTGGMATLLATPAATAETRSCFLWRHNPELQDSSSMVLCVCVCVCAQCVGIFVHTYLLMGSFTMLVLTHYI